MNGLQFSIRQVLALTFSVAITLALVRFIGWRTWYVGALVAVISGPLLLGPRRHLYVFLLPAIWAPVAYGNFHHCGDEYGGFGVGSMAGLWTAILFNIMSPKSILPPTLLTGIATMGVAGWILDRLRAPWSIFATVWILIAVAIFAQWFGRFPSVERALAKNGSYETYLFTSSNFGLTAATVLLLFSFAMLRFVQFCRRKLRVED